MNICLLNDSFPPQIDGVANTVVNYAQILKKHGHEPIVATPHIPGGEEDEKYDFPILRYPGIDVRDKVGYVASKKEESAAPAEAPVVEAVIDFSKVEIEPLFEDAVDEFPRNRSKIHFSWRSNAGYPRTPSS